MVVVTRERDFVNRYGAFRHDEVEVGDRVVINGDEYVAEQLPYIDSPKPAFNIDGTWFVLDKIHKDLRLCPTSDSEYGSYATHHNDEVIEVDTERSHMFEQVDLFEQRRGYILDFLNSLVLYPGNRYPDNPDYADDKLAEYMENGKLPKVGEMVEETKDQLLCEPAEWHDEMFGEPAETIDWTELEEGDTIIARNREKIQERADRDFMRPSGGGIYEVGEVNENRITLLNSATGNVFETVSPDWFEKRYASRRVVTDEYFKPNTYFRTCFFGLLLDNHWLTKSEDEVLEGYKRLRNKNMPGYLPSDGSKGQWRTAMRHKLTGIKWLLGLDELSEAERERILNDDETRSKEPVAE